MSINYSTEKEALKSAKYPKSQSSMLLAHVYTAGFSAYKQTNAFFFSRALFIFCLQHEYQQKQDRQNAAKDDANTTKSTIFLFQVGLYKSVFYLSQTSVDLFAMYVLNPCAKKIISQGFTYWKWHIMSVNGPCSLCLYGLFY